MAERVVVAAVFADAESLRDAAGAASTAGLGRLTAYTPAPVEGLDAALVHRPDRPAPFGLAGFLAGGLFAFGLITYATLVSYKLDIGGRPAFSWPLYVVPCVAFGLLCAAVVLFVRLLWLSGLPQLNHPAFDLPEFERVSTDRFILCVHPRDTDDREATPHAIRRFLDRLPAPPLSVRSVAW